MGPIEAYVADLDRALRGPRRVKADLLREARDGLLDAAEGHRAAGLDRDHADRRAITEFGDVRRVAPGYQRELGHAQSVRTAVLICCVLAPQDAAWDAVSRFTARTADPGPAFLAVSGLMSWLGATALLGCVLAVLAHGVGQRYVGARPALTRAVGGFALAVAAVFATAAVLLTVLGPNPGSLAGLALTAGLVIAPMAVVARSGRQCLAWSA